MSKNADEQAITQPGAAQSPLPNTAVGALVSTDAMLKKVFFFSLLFMLVTAWIAGFNVGFHGDELDMNNYGKANLAFYTSLGQDKSCVDGTILKQESRGPDSLLRYYGCAFDYFAVGTNKLLGTENGLHEFDVRHFFSQTFGICILLFAGLIARKLAGWRAAVIALWLLFLSPSFFGHVYINTKDIPFCLGYVASLYFIIGFLQELPNPTWRTSTCLMLSFAFATNTRIGGVILLVYLGLFLLAYLFTDKELRAAVPRNARSIILKLVFIAFGGMVLVVVTWPYLLLNPVAHIQEAFEVVSKFPMKVNVNFEGELTNSFNLPAHYLPKLLALTTPVLVLCLLVTGLAFMAVKRRRQNKLVALVVIFSTCFPLLYAIATHLAVYSGWRHVLFIYPGIAIIAAYGLNEIFTRVKKPVLQLAVGAACLLGLTGPLIFTVKNHPYEYCYFNELAGGFGNAYYNYDTDYWTISMKKSLDWLIANESIAASKDTITIATNQSRFVDYYLKRHCPESKIKVVVLGLYGRNETYWQYAVFNNFFVRPDYLKEYFPPPQTIFSEKIDGLVATAVIKDMARLDYKAFQAVNVARHQLADSLYTAYIATTGDHNPAIDAYIALSKGSLGQNAEAITAGNRALQMHFSTVLDYNALCGLGIANANLANYAESISALTAAEKMMPEERYAKDILAQVYRVMALEGRMHQPR